MNRKNILRMLTLLLALMLCFAGCKAPAEPTEPDYSDFTNPTWAPVEVEELSVLVTDESIANLDKYPGLKKVDLSGSTCYDAILAYIESHPDVEVTYTVSLGSVFVSTESSDLILMHGTFDYDTMMENLAYLPQVKSIKLPKTELTPEQLSAITQQYPEIAVDYTVEFNGTEYGTDVTELDLSEYDPAQVDTAARQLAMMPFITKVELMKEDGTSAYTHEQVKVLQAAAPHAAFSFTFELFGKTVSAADELVDFSGINIGEEALREALDMLPNCVKMDVEGCGLDNETLAAIQADYPNTKLVWRVKVASTSFLTDEETLFLSQMKLTNSNVENLKYLTSAKYVDAGHSEQLTNISWLAHMPDLEILILSGSPITDISPLANCTKLDWLELVFCGELKDISPVKNLTNLRYLNIGMTEVSDISPVEDLPLLRFHALSTNTPHADFEAYIASHPDTWTTYKGSSQPYGKGWRYEDAGYTFSECYLRLAEIFDYASRT